MLIRHYVNHEFQVINALAENLGTYNHFLIILALFPNVDYFRQRYYLHFLRRDQKGNDHQASGQLNGI